jgi:NAD dependent epimerase/dehydratase
MNETKIEIKNKKILVTGAAGFIGSHLVEELLRKNNSVRALVKYNSRSDIGFLKEISPELASNLEIIHGDIRDPFAVDSSVKDMDVVFHLAALIGIPFSYTAPQSYVETNISGTLNILEACKKHSVKKVVLTSTSEVYGTALFTPITEEHPLQPQSPYSATKISADSLGISYTKSFELPLSIVRPFNTFGPRQSMRAVIPTIIVQALTKDKINLGDLTTTRDFNFITDTVSGFISVAERGRPDGTVYNIATEKGITIGHTAECILKIVGRSLPIESDFARKRPPESEVRKLIGCSQRAQQELGWRSEITLEQGLIETISWVNSNLDKFPDSDNYAK